MVVSFIRFVYSNTPKRSWAFFMMVVLLGFVGFGCGGKLSGGVEGYFRMATWPVLYTTVSSLENRSFSLTVISPFLFFLCLVYYLYGLPEGYMALIPGAEDAVEKP